MAHIRRGAASEKKIFVQWEKFDKKDKTKDKIDKIFLSIFLMKLLITAFFLRFLPSLPLRRQDNRINIKKQISKLLIIIKNQF
jgi:hypothetical protein